MAQKRMFDIDIVNSDKFLDMPATTQLLYYHLGMRADDEGFISSPKNIMRMLGACEDDIKLLIAKGYIISFDSGIIVIRHWKINNYLNSSRIKKTLNTEEKSMLIESGSGEYVKNDECVKIEVKPKLAYRLEENRIEENRIEENRIEENRIEESEEKKENIVKVENTETGLSKDNLYSILKKWNSLGLQQIKKINSNTNRYRMLKTRIREYGIDEFMRAIENINVSDFLRGQNNRGWIATFDWFLKPNNFLKVLDGNYNNATKFVDPNKEDYDAIDREIEERTLRETADWF